ncbi:hypothetical protein G7Z17_g12795 [Cylindrodendrum hubeiense]|uniref:FAD-binding domain-containing protein n=1 Tax=Cylindrodendrum hubeiense TaxID=595255 RepID=A0A9P5GUV0_9HYPO|nr:hypothetical protein G7Z17_g12795 [Cylindrodendrum hubeiense]
MSNINKTSVIVVGGSLVGLSTALFLSSWKVPVILLERHHSSSLHPRAIGYTTRTIECFRSLGIDSRLPVTQWKGGPPRRITIESLAGKWQDEKLWTPKAAGPPEDKKAGRPKGPEEFSPVAGIATAQDKIEPVLRECAIEQGADLRLGYTVASWSQNEQGVTVAAMDRDGVEIVVEGKYIVACDGARSPIREKLGIQRDGVGHLKALRSILFRCPQIDHYLNKGFVQFQIEGREDGFEAFMTTYGEGRWALMWNPVDKLEATKDAIDEATQKDMIRKAVGEEIPDNGIDLITTGEWELSGLVADKFSSGRVFLAGDAAHALPPNRGGYGANTGIADAHNISWKLAAVLNGTSRPELLATYDAERRSAAMVRHDQIFTREDYGRHVAGLEWAGKNAKILDDVAMELGQIYRSGAVIGADESLPLAKRPDEWNGQPGTRAPHVPLRRGGEAISSLDLFCHGWVLVSKDGTWRVTAQQASGTTGTEVAFVQVGGEVEETEGSNIGESFGIGETGAVLVRPDGYVAWRSLTKPVDAVASLGSALGQVSYAVKNST